MKGCFLITADSNDCVEGPNRTFFGVSKGSSFHCISCAIVFIWFSIWILQTFRRNGGLIEDRFELFTITGILIAIQALGLAAPWGSLSTTLDYLECDEHPESLPRNGEVILKCAHFESTAAAICVLSSLIFCTSTAAVSMLYMWDNDLLSSNSVTGGGVAYESMASPNTTTNRPSQNTNTNNVSTDIEHPTNPVVAYLGGSTGGGGGAAAAAAGSGGGSRAHAQSIPGLFSNVNNRTIVTS